MELNLVMLTLLNGKCILINLNHMVSLQNCEDEEGKISGAKIKMVNGDELYIKEDMSLLLKFISNEDNNLNKNK